MKSLGLFRVIMSIVLVCMLLALSGCSGSDGSNGTNGTNATNGANGTNGEPGSAGGTAKVTDKHGEAIALTAELKGALQSNVVITGATADAAGSTTVTFTVKTAAGAAVSGLGGSANRVSFAIASLAPAGGGVSYNSWVPYIYRADSVTATVNQGYHELNSPVGGFNPLVEGPAGSYTYTFAKNLTRATYPVGGGAISYDRTRTHRVMVAMQTDSGYVGGATFDFVPNGSAVTATRDIVEDATCRKCHMNTPGHYGPWSGILKACVMCHSPGSYLVNSAADGGATNSLEAAVMIHKIHAGRELRTVAGPDGQFYDNPQTTVKETADNGPLYQLGHLSTWNTAAFPAVLANCQACHTGATADVNNWKNVPSRAACGSCHDDINWATGANHSNGAYNYPNDNDCTVCHLADSGTSPITVSHDWTTKDIRNIPEFDITIATDTPARGYYIKGEKPVVSITLKDHFTGAVIVPSTIIQDPVAEGCLPREGAKGTECTTPRDGLFTGANVYVSGPRAQKVNNMTFAARAVVLSANSWPWNLSAGGGKLQVKVDSGQSMRAYNNASQYFGYGADILIPGDITVTLPAAGAALNALFANPAAATPGEVAAWLNADPTFKLRAIAYVNEALAGNANAGKLAIRSRGLAKLDKNGEVVETTAQRNIQLVAMPVTGMFAAADTGVWKTAGGADSLRIMATANATNPKADFTGPTAIKYTLDPVDDLVAGTYIIGAEFADAGRAPAPANPANPPFVDYRTPSVAVTTFQVKTATTEKPVAGNCTACHWSSADRGFSLDFPRHNKHFNAQATDQCGGCHDYGSAQNPSTTTQLNFVGALSNRVHAVHNGSRLNTPTLTVGHEESEDFGRNWNITYPMDIRNCESCHTAATSGTWKTNPNRLACSGCHDSDAAKAHMKSQTIDPTPLAPFSGDEEESCSACH